MKVFQKYWIGFFLVLLLFSASVLIYNQLHQKKLPSNLIIGSGRIDGDLINLNSKYPGRIEKMLVEEGESITAGSVVARLNSQEIEARADALDAQVDAAKKELSAKQNELTMAQRSIPLSLEKAYAGRKSAKAGIEAMKQTISALKALVVQDEKDYKRLQNLFAQKLIERHQVELARLKYQTDREKLHALKQQKIQLEASYDVAETTLKEAEVMQGKLKTLKEAVSAMRENVKALEASRKEMDAILAEMHIKAPVSGYIVEKIANIGEVIGAGMPVVTMIDPKSLYLKLFVDTLQNGKIKIGDKAVIFLDAYPDKAISAKVVSIAQKAEFTPKEVSVRDDRIQRVYAVHLKPVTPNPLLKLGIPAIGVITIDGKDLPASLEELPPL